MANGAPGEALPVLSRVLAEESQTAPTRQPLIREASELLGRPLLVFATSFSQPVMIDDSDVDLIEGMLQAMELSAGLAILISSPGGNAIAAERIVNICRSYSGTGEYWAVVPGRAKSAATMVCLGASKILMGASSELGPTDPQLVIEENGVRKRFSVWNVVKSYEGLFAKAVRTKGNLGPFLQQLEHYDAREIEEYRSAQSLAEDIVVRCLRSGMMQRNSATSVTEKMRLFLTPKQTKAHGRPIFEADAANCGLNIEHHEPGDKLWDLCQELQIRTDRFVTTHASKCAENSTHSFYAPHIRSN